MSQHLEEDTLMDLVLELLPREREQELLAHVVGCRSCEELMRQRAAEMARLESIRNAAVRLSSTTATRSIKRSGSLIQRLLGGAWTGRRLIPLGAIAAGIAIVFFIVTGREHSVPMDIEANWLPSADAIVQRNTGADGAAIAALTAGLAAYGRHDLPAAIQNLGIASVPYELDGFRRLYLGNALALAGDHDRAVAILRPVRIEFLPEPWATEGYWTLLVALERGGRRASADSLRRVLSEHPGELGERVARLSAQTR